MSIYVFDQQEAELSSVADADEMIIHDDDAGITKKVGVDTLRQFMTQGLVDVTDSTVTLTAAAHALGCTLPEPLMTMSFLALPVIPSLKLTDKGLVDVGVFDFVPLFGG